MSGHKILRFYICFILLSILPGVAQAGDLNLLPQPQAIELQPGEMPLRNGFEVRYRGVNDARLNRAVARLYDRLSAKLGFAVIPQPPVKDAPSLEISCDSKSEKVQRAQEDESYSLTVTSTGAMLRAHGELGVLHGIETFYQLAASTPDGFGSVPAVTIKDGPRFPWRGLLLDVARHYMSLDQIKREIDGLAAVKMNVLHLHLSDDQSFRVESAKFPELTKKSSHGQYYTQSDIKELVAYAQDRGVRILPEFDVPGHSTAWLAAFPELAVTKANPDETFIRFGGYENTLDPSNPKLLKVLDTLFGEMAKLFPDEYFHIGGDEVVYRHWQGSESIANFKKKHNLTDDRAVQAYFNTQLEKMLQKHGKKMVGWNEILHADLPKTTVVHSWTGVKPLEEAVSRGYPVVCSMGYYLDWYMPAAFYYGIDPLRPNPKEFDDLIGVLPVGTNTHGLLNQRAQAEAFRPSPDAERLVLGGEAAEWTETAGPWSIDTIIWPRLAAIAERLWSSADVTDVSSLYRRFDALSLELSDLGISSDENLRKLRVRLAENNESAQIITTFAEVLEPTQYYTRNVQHKNAGTYNLNSPLNRLVDAVPPESPVARRFGLAVAGYLKTRDAEHLAYLQSALERWKSNDAALWRLVKQNPRVAEAAALADVLRLYLNAAEDAISYMERGQQPPASWFGAQHELLSVQIPVESDLRLAITPYVKALVEAAAKQPAGSLSAQRAAAE